MPRCLWDLPAGAGNLFQSPLLLVSVNEVSMAKMRACDGDTDKRDGQVISREHDLPSYLLSVPHKLLVIISRIASDAGAAIEIVKTIGQLQTKFKAALFTKMT